MAEKLNKFNWLIKYSLLVAGSFFLIVSLWARSIYQEIEEVDSILKKQAPLLTVAHRLQLAWTVTTHARRHGFDPLLLMAVMKVESEFRPHVVSSRGAIGLLQIKPIAAREVSNKFGLSFQSREELFDPIKNVIIGAQYLAYLDKMFGFDLTSMLTAYNQGPAHLSKRAGIYSGYSKKVIATYKRFQKRQKS